MFTIEQVGKIVHEANKALCEATGDMSQKSWEEAEAWQRESAIEGIQWRLANMDAPDSAQHEQWMEDKFKDGWMYGEEIDSAAKTHPCLVPFAALPPEQQAKDVLFSAIVKAFQPWMK